MIKLEQITIKEAAEIGEGNEQLLKEMMDKFRQWLEQQMHLPQKISDQRLQRIILTSKFNFEKAKKRIDSLYTLRSLIPEFFGKYDPLDDDITQFHTYMQWVPLPKLTPDKYRAYFVRFLKDEKNLFNPWVIFKYGFMIMDVRAEEDMVNSDIVIWDCRYLTLDHILKYTPSMMRKCDLVLEAFGIRFKAIYVINAPSYFDQLLKIIKLVMTPKLYDRIYICGIESVQAIPKSILPADYGGEAPSMETLTDMWRAKLKERRDWLLEQEKFKVDESLRVSGAINVDDLFGVAGTFRKLEID